MAATTIKNVIFDIGNVVVRWSPLEIIRLTFGDNIDAQSKAREVFQHSIWMDLNKGRLTEQQAKQAYQEQLHFSELEAEKLFYNVRQTLTPLYGSQQLIERLKHAGYGVYSLTDNVTELVDYLKQQYDFWPLFDGATISADVDMLKPQAEIYLHLLQSNRLVAEECIFLDDMPHNVEGAKAVGIDAIQFAHAHQAEQELKARGLEF
ncbi:HAD family hydrolase [Vibrio intestinalis]|uniref:HAD family hydrolase n=1 Tax=Vibrio intestinalis TaxID=2933291 RepID=UPI0021A3AFED|nr:HAD family phosphatase [Vibrio intestinalis]